MRSPIKLECEWIIPKAEAMAIIRETGPALPRGKRARGTIEAVARQEFQVCRWRCRGPVRAAKFISRRDPEEYAVVHPATKARGRWQITYFDAAGPYSDTSRPTCTEAMAELRPWQWRLRDVR